MTRISVALSALLVAGCGCKMPPHLSASQFEWHGAPAYVDCVVGKEEIPTTCAVVTTGDMVRLLNERARYCAALSGDAEGCGTPQARRENGD